MIYYLNKQMKLLVRSFLEFSKMFFELIMVQKVKEQDKASSAGGPFYLAIDRLYQGLSGLGVLHVSCVFRSSNIIVNLWVT